MIRQDLQAARISGVHAFLPHELLNFALPARRTTEKDWSRKNGVVTYTVTAGKITDQNRNEYSELPSGKYARAALLYLCTQAKLTNEPTITITESYRAFIRDLGMEWQGTARTKEALRQLMLVSAASFSVNEDPYVDASTGEVQLGSRRGTISSASNLWVTPDRTALAASQPSTVTLSPAMMEMIDRAVPMSMKAWRWLLAHSKSPMALDIYGWLCSRLYRCDATTRVSWQQLYDQFGSTAPLKRFKQHFRAALETALLVYPDAQIKEEHGTHRLRGFKGFYLSPSPDPRDSKTPDET